MPDQPVGKLVDWRELTRMPMFVDVKSCVPCPLNSYSTGYCGHPSAKPQTHTRIDTPPLECPLRSGSLTIQLAATLR